MTKTVAPPGKPAVPTTAGPPFADFADVQGALAAIANGEQRLSGYRQYAAMVQDYANGRKRSDEPAKPDARAAQLSLGPVAFHSTGTACVSDNGGRGEIMPHRTDLTQMQLEITSKMAMARSVLMAAAAAYIERFTPGRATGYMLMRRREVTDTDSPIGFRVDPGPNLRRFLKTKIGQYLDDIHALAEEARYCPWLCDSDRQEVAAELLGYVEQFGDVVLLRGKRAPEDDSPAPTPPPTRGGIEPDTENWDEDAA
jgi:hypothetical protein